MPPRAFAVAASPGLRRPDPDDPTTALHQRYHDANIQYTVNNLEWVEKKGYSEEPALAVEERASRYRAARERLRRWPRLTPEDASRIRFRQEPQRFCPPGHDAEALGDPGEHVFVISLARRPQKLAHALGQLRAAGLAATLVSAADGDALEARADLGALGVQILDGYAGYSNHDMPFTTGEVGCFLSHYTIWHHMVENQIPAALILEDDFDLQEDFSRRLGENLLEARDSDWNLMYVGRSPMENDVRRVGEHVVQPGYTLWTVGYILKLEAARALLDTEAERHMVPLDDFFSVSMGCGRDGQYNELAAAWSAEIPPVLRGLAMNPPLVMPYVGAMFLSDTAMLRPGTRYVKDLPAESREPLRPAADDRGGAPPPGGPETPEEVLETPAGDLTAASAGVPGGMPEAWRAALEQVEAMQLRLLALGAVA